MSELVFALLIVGIVIIFGVLIPVILVGTWVYKDAQNLETGNSWLTPKVWVAIVLLTNYLGLIFYFSVRKSLAKKVNCPYCGYPNEKQANFCGQCGEPLEVESFYQEQRKNGSYRRLIAGGVSLIAMIMMLIGLTVYFVQAEGIQTYSYDTIALGTKKLGGIGKEYRGREFRKLIGSKDVFHFTTEETPAQVTYELQAEKGSIKAMIQEEDGPVVLEAVSSEMGKALKKLKPNTKYRVTVEVKEAEKGKYLFNWE